MPGCCNILPDFRVYLHERLHRICKDRIYGDRECMVVPFGCTVTYVMESRSVKYGREMILVDLNCSIRYTLYVTK